MCRKRTHIKKLILAIVLLLVLVGPPVWITYREYRQARLDHALIEAIKAGDDKKALEALAKGANGEARENKEPPTFQEALRNLLDHLRHPGKPLANQADDENLSALLLLYRIPFHDNGDGPFSVRQPDLTVLQTLLDHGAHVNDQDEFGNTALHFAAIYTNGDSINLLLSRGADVNLGDKKGFTPLIFAKAEATRVLLEHGANIEAVGTSKTTSLTYAAMYGETDTVRILLEHGANVEAQDSYGRTTLLNLVCTAEGRYYNRDETAIARLLLEHGSKVGAKDKYGKTALNYVRNDPDPYIRKIAALLRKYGAK